MVSALNNQNQSVGLEGLEVQQLAAEGYFQAIAYWLNEPLVPQNVYAQVLADSMPGCIKILVEFERAPQPKRLLKFVCGRIYRLNSNVIEGIYLVARVIGTGKTDWAQRVRIPTVQQRQQNANPALDTTAGAAVDDTALTDDVSSADPATDSAQRQPENAAHKSKPFVHESSRSKLAREVVRRQFKFFRAALITGSAATAFLFGGLTELILSERLSDPVATDVIPTAAPWYDEPDATEVAFSVGNAPLRRRTVEASLETVAVVPHTDVAQPDDPTVTLLFGGEIGLNDFVFEEAESLDRLFSDLSIYQQADVAMVGLSEPLAMPSTSLQENFYHRTRPQAARMLRAGGIDIVNLASEGTLVYGSRGLDETLKTLDRQGIYRVGAGRNQREAHRPEILEVKGQRIAYLGYNPEAVKAAKDDAAGVALTNSKERSHIVEDIRAIRNQVDWVVVNYRWGDVLGHASDSSDVLADPSSDFAAIPEAWQTSLAHDAVDAGADLVVGYHPSRIQGAEIYRDRAIAYSLGDFVFGEAPLEDHDTAALRVSLRNHQMKIEFLPVSVRDSQIQMATGEQGTQILQGIRDASKNFDQPLRFPTVLKATPTHLPSDSPPLDTPHLTTPPSIIEPVDRSLQPSTLPITVPDTSEMPESLSPVLPLPAELVPEDALIEKLPTESYADPAPHPILKESEALFPSSESGGPGAADIDPAAPDAERDAKEAATNVEKDAEEDRHSAMPEQGSAPSSDGIEPYEEPLIGPLAALPASVDP